MSQQPPATDSGGSVADEMAAILAPLARPDQQAQTNRQGQPPRTGDADGKRVLEEIRQILGPLSKTRAPVSSADDKSALSAALTEKYGS